jgi:hypothetical protein
LLLSNSGALRVVVEGTRIGLTGLGGQFIGENPMLSVISAAVNRPEKNTSSNARVYL